MSKPNIFFRLTKVDAIQGIFEAIATAEVEDKSGETCHYETTKPYYQKWSAEIQKASGGKSLGNIRAMHGNVAAGKVIAIDFDDANKAIRITGKIIDKAEKEKLAEGVYTGVSQGGEYVEKWTEDGVNYYTADPSEISIVDNPCLAAASFEVVKADGTHEMRKLKTTAVNVTPDLEQVWKAKDGSTWRTKADAVKQNTMLDAKETVGKSADPAQAIIDDINNSLDKKETNVKPDLQKLLKSESWDAATAIDALQTVEYLMSGEEQEAGEGEDEAQQVADLKMVIERLKAFIASEIQEGTEGDDTPEALAAMAKAKAAEKEPPAPPADHQEHVEAIHKAAGHIMKKCMKCMSPEAEKIFKALADDDALKEHINAIHKKASGIADHAVALGAKLPVDDDQEPPTEPGDEAEKFVKMTAVNTELQKTITSLTTQLTEIQKRLVVVENQPAPRKGRLMTVTKGHERTEEPEERAAESRPLNIDGLSPEEARSLLS